jgi:hypothetical protein
MTKSNYGPNTRAWVRFTATIPSGTGTSEILPYAFGDFALGTVAISGAYACSGHLSILPADYWNLYRTPRSWSANYSDWVIQTPSADKIHTMPPAWFGVVGSARLWLTDGSGGAILASAAGIVFAIDIKS